VVSDARHVGGRTCRRPLRHRTSVHIEVGHGQGAPEPGPQEAGSRRAAEERGRRGTPGKRTRPSKGGPCQGDLQEGPLPKASTLAAMSPHLQKGVDRARREPQGRFHSLAHLSDVPALMRAYHRQRASAAVGGDGITKEQYGPALRGNLEDLHARLKAKTDRHQPIRRVHIPQGQGKTRPIGISAFEDKVVQDAVREGLEVLYAQDFLACS
jgi:hypothetical protein